jgi:hypothetical protein
MGYVSAIILFFFIWVTQLFTSIDKPVSLEQHVQLQDELSQFIETYVRENIPTVTEFKMYSLYTGSPSKNKIKAYFNYAFKNPAQDAITELDGVATLQKIKDTPQQEWSLDGIDISGEVVTFTDPIVITPSTDSKKESSETN